MGDRIGSGRIGSGRIVGAQTSGSSSRYRSVSRSNFTANQGGNATEPHSTQQTRTQSEGRQYVNPNATFGHHTSQQNWRTGANRTNTDHVGNRMNHRSRYDNENYNRGKQKMLNDEKKKTYNKFHVGFKKLIEWSNESPDTIIAALVNQRVGFEDFLETKLSNDAVVLVLKILAKMCLSPFNVNKTEIMYLISRDNFISHLTNLIMMLPLQEREERRWNTHFWNDIDGFFSNLSILCESFIETIPTRACETLPKMIKAVILMLPNFESQQEYEVPPEIKQKFAELQTKLELCKVEIERKKQINTPDEEEETPPDDFRQLTVYPTSTEILQNERPFLRQHIITGSYNDVDHYLDVQFRLLKEDFVAPLREGITTYIHQDFNVKKRISNVKIHPHVEFICPKFNKDQVGVLVQFEFNTKKTRRNYNYSKRFIYGSLVCFTGDNFQSLLFGKIIERDAELLEKRQVVVAFEADYNTYKLNQPYIMVECSVYFEPYYHVLKALQNMHDEGFPMREYIINVTSEVKPPKYLNQNSTYKIDTFDVTICLPNSWPNSDELGLDETQLNAYKAALTREFVVIQGPPGTGKTYVGLKIAKTLIKNKSSWSSTPVFSARMREVLAARNAAILAAGGKPLVLAGRNTPILVVCFTNHALDQFLEGLIGTTDKIVRVGGQSKNKKLEQFNLRMKRRNSHHAKGIDSALYRLRNELGHQLTKIKNWSEELEEIHKYHSIINFKHFHNIDKNFANSWFAKASDEDILKWLFGGGTRQQRQQELLQARLDGLQQLHEQNFNKSDEELDNSLNILDRTENDIDDGIDLSELLEETSEKLTLLTSIPKLEYSIHCLKIYINNLNKEVNVDAVYDKTWELQRECNEREYTLEHLKVCLHNGKHAMVTRKPDDINLQQPQHMTPDERWNLYFYWLEQYRRYLLKKLTHLQQGHHRKYQQYVELQHIDDMQIMREMLVIGMTTTGAARLQTTLQALKCRIVIVEEAAEVLESHIIVSLTNHCEHLILIGDHQQLRPNTANFQINTKFNLGISLFERMIQNNVEHHTLGVQHRMRPEIAKLIVPAIYPVLQNHSSVYDFPQVSGVDLCMYFIDHKHPEEEANDSSKLNVHEAEFLIGLARYLIQNGYKPEDITILAAYSGQMFTLWRQRKKYDILLQDVRITVLDNYQGEESKIILLSLVRNNDNNKIGFLHLENRVCVALSRAKEGFYLMGNMDLLCRNSKIWPKIKESFESQGFLGEELTLRCQIHPDRATKVKLAKDFKNVPEGGCNQVCGMDMDCGHKCAKICHILDRLHKETKCKAPCSKILCTKNHQCQKMCYEECGPCTALVKTTLQCEHEHFIPCFVNPEEYNCRTPVPAELPCGHKVTDKPCRLNVDKFRCPFPCDARVEPCGHACERTCHVKDDPDHLKYKCRKQCAKPREGCSTGEHMCPNPCHLECPPCEVVIQKIRTVCPHRFSIACSFNVDEVECHKPCTKTLPCSHKCKRKCYEPCGNCQVMVNKMLPECGHVVKAKCSELPNRKLCKGKCPLRLNCEHICQKRCNEPCTTTCKELTDHDKVTACGHKFQIECHLRSIELPSNSHQLLKFCKEPCKVVLECSHPCSGTCGECAQGRIHKTCKEKCGVPLICGHECLIPCRQTCQPCTRKCSYRCKHSACKKTCGEPCTRCQENCTRQCRHIKCTAKCGDKCTVPPCTEPCNKILQCDHLCVGFCGDPCPPLCRICNHEELTDIFLGHEDEDDSKFVLLNECKHVIESRGMEEWLKRNENEVTYKCCPRCKTPLAFTQRYSDYIKETMEDIITIKKKSFGNHAANEAKRAELLKRLQDLEDACGQLTISTPCLIKLLANFKSILNPVRRGKRQPLHKLLASTCTSKIEIVENIVDTINNVELKNRNTSEKVAKHADFLFGALMRQERIQTHEEIIEAQRITQQEIFDFEREIKRLSRIMQLCQIQDHPKFLSVIDKPHVKLANQEIDDIVFSVSVYTNQMHSDLKNKLSALSREVETGIPITDKERREIVQAIGLGKGHWYKCPNGHFYAIADCGGATNVSKCIECKAEVGGRDHRLLQTNAHAGEMDGSRYPAYSETANNLFNFEEFRNHL